MDRDQFREQITQRYVTGKALEGSSMDEIAKGMVDPVEQMNYVTGQSKSKQKSTAPTSPCGDSGLAWLVFIALIAVAVLSGLLKIFF